MTLAKVNTGWGGGGGEVTLGSEAWDDRRKVQKQ